MSRDNVFYFNSYHIASCGKNDFTGSAPQNGRSLNAVVSGGGYLKLIRSLIRVDSEKHISIHSRCRLLPCRGVGWMDRTDYTWWNVNLCRETRQGLLYGGCVVEIPSFRMDCQLKTVSLNNQSTMTWIHSLYENGSDNKKKLIGT